MGKLVAVLASAFVAIAASAVSNGASGPADDTQSPKTMKQMEEQIKSLEKRVEQLEKQQNAQPSIAPNLPPQLHIVPSPPAQAPQVRPGIPGWQAPVLPYAQPAVPDGWGAKEFNGQYYYIVPLADASEKP